MPKNFYITTTLPYVNAEAHMGHAMEFIRADIIARYHKLLGDNVFFNTGTDEHGIKIYKKALEKGQTPQEFVDYYASKFRTLLDLLNVEPTNFVRTTDANHIKSAQAFWLECEKNGYIYKKAYKVKYCVGCELEKTDSELVNGKCVDHQNIELELIDEENYFFKFSAFQDKLTKFYDEHSDFVLPESRFNEIKSFVKTGLQDFSISRLKDKMPWGIEVPNDPAQVMYVWFDALVNYISVLGWPHFANASRGTPNLFEDYWVNGETVQYCGKDNLRQQSAMWQAMLMAANLPNSQKIIIDGFVTAAGGVKMSKSLGNVVNPLEIIEEYGTDALRYYVAREIHPFEDTPFTKESFKEAYNANLANGLGNLVSRVMTLSEKYIDKRVVELIVEDVEHVELNSFIKTELDNFNIQLACDMVWQYISKLDEKLSKEVPFKVIKKDVESGKKMFGEKPSDDRSKNIGYLWDLATIACSLKPFMPTTAQKIIDIMKANKKPEVPLFVRKD